MAKSPRNDTALFEPRGELVRIGLLSNLRAGRSTQRTGQLLNLLKGFPEVASVETTAAAAVPEALGELARQDIEVLVVNGGDGTLTHTLTEILGNRAFGDRVPTIAPLRGGRTNMSACDLGAHKDPVRGLEEIIRAARSGRIEQRISTRRVLRVSPGPLDPAEYGMFFGAGMIYRAVCLAHKHLPARKGQGAMGSTALTAGLMLRTALGDHGGVLRPDKVDLRLDGKPAPHAEYRLLIASTLDRLFAGMNPFWGEGPGGIRVTGIAASARRFAFAAPRLLRGRPAPWITPEEGYMSQNALRADLQMSCGYTIDGELFEPEPEQIVSITAHDRIPFARA